MPDVYRSMTELYQHETEGVNYTKEWKRHKKSTYSDPGFETVIIAPHGGSIEIGTTELALATAGYTSDFNGTTETAEVYDYFIFNGLNQRGENQRLHVTSTRYDDPIALELIENSMRTLAYHGCRDLQPTGGYDGYQACLIGGRDIDLMEKIRRHLAEEGFHAWITRDKRLRGHSSKNLINRNKQAKGVQLELTTSLRWSFFANHTRSQRRKTTTPDFWKFVNAVRRALSAT
ncbi:poly-gamma-glutamate hydrolase family protein [Thermoflavimicrobium dichotomicum]|uniref:Phage-related replication protein YjqB, UPF0714/DUF867 family n=1 Tax=Thermoflavimicrobium dichotomicum TaxID=46223 RepID=A0A1I3P5R1_9BACL|nr:poly-gamma-glutamate hydrolase family protein [Thermoflavimicrobium dichotomicum]SFJ16690.1 Phage-related replication protein YjqB, UPF0714/DUF867 family [Thermoflavimicrobium dichotomicum]